MDSNLGGGRPFNRGMDRGKIYILVAPLLAVSQRRIHDVYFIWHDTKQVYAPILRRYRLTGKFYPICMALPILADRQLDPRMDHLDTLAVPAFRPEFAITTANNPRFCYVCQCHRHRVGIHHPAAILAQPFVGFVPDLNAVLDFIRTWIQ